MIRTVDIAVLKISKLITTGVETVAKTIDCFHNSMLIKTPE
jgi:hypothetical protein